MAGMYDPFGANWGLWLAVSARIIASFETELLTIDGLMGKYHPGYESYWVDYDELDVGR
jgi:hypothetical protein